MSKTHALQLARKQLSGGYFAVGGQDARVQCPHPACNRSHDVLLYGMCGRRPSHGEMVRQLALAVLDCEYNLAATNEHHRGLCARHRAWGCPRGVQLPQG